MEAYLNPHMLIMALVGVLVGLGASFSGLGGGFLMVPLSIFLGLTVKEAVGTSFLAILVISSSALIAHRRLKNINVKVGIWLGIGGLAGAQIGARLLPYVSDIFFKRLFGVILLLLALRMVLDRGKKTPEGVGRSALAEPGAQGWRILAMLGLGVAIGVAASFTGLGGGFLMVPMAIFLGLTVQEAVGTSFLAILIISVSALIAHSKLAHVNYPVGLALGVGGIVGAQIGARLLTYVSGSTFKKIFAGILVFLALRMFWA